MRNQAKQKATMANKHKQQDNPEVGCTVYANTQHVSAQVLRTYVREYVQTVTTTPMEYIVYTITLCVQMLCWNGNITSCRANLDLINQVRTAAAHHLNTRDPEEAIKLICEHPKKPKFPAKLKGVAAKIQDTSKQLRSIIGTDLHLVMENQITSWKQLFRENAEKTTYLVFFYITPLSGEILYQRYQETINRSSEAKHAAGEHPMYGNYIQIVYKSNDRMFIPGNNRGNAFIIGKDITDGVTKGNMDVLGCLNKSICGNLYRGLYPNDISPKR